MVDLEDLLSRVIGEDVRDESSAAIARKDDEDLAQAYVRALGRVSPEGGFFSSRYFILAAYGAVHDIISGLWNPICKVLAGDDIVEMLEEEMDDEFSPDTALIDYLISEYGSTDERRDLFRKMNGLSLLRERSVEALSSIARNSGRRPAEIMDCPADAAGIFVTAYGNLDRYGSAQGERILLIRQLADAASLGIRDCFPAEMVRSFLAAYADDDLVGLLSTAIKGDVADMMDRYADEMSHFSDAIVSEHAAVLLERVDAYKSALLL